MKINKPQRATTAIETLARLGVSAAGIAESGATIAGMGVIGVLIVATIDPRR